jgi:hypothetical protein
MMVAPRSASFSHHSHKYYAKHPSSAPRPGALPDRGRASEPTDGIDRPFLVRWPIPCVITPAESPLQDRSDEPPQDNIHGIMHLSRSSVSRQKYKKLEKIFYQ